MNAQNRQTPPTTNQTVSAEELHFRYLHKLQESILKAEEHEDAVNVRKAEVRSVVIDTLAEECRRTGQQMTEARITERLNQRLKTDPYYKVWIAGNQWYIAKATMYGTAAQAFGAQMDRERVLNRSLTSFPETEQ